MIVVTGGAGFIGSCLAARLNERGREDLIIVDALDTSDKWRNLRALRFAEYLDKSTLLKFLDSGIKPDAVLRTIGAERVEERVGAHHDHGQEQDDHHGVDLFASVHLSPLRIARLCGSRDR